MKCFVFSCSPYEVISDNEVVAVDEDSRDVAQEEDHDNAHQNECEVDLTFYRVSSSFMCKP